MRRFSRLVLATVVGACGPAGPDRQELNVYAASSLTEAFRELEHEFEVAHGDTDVSVTFAGSQVLRLQIEQGAGADVFASADADHMRALVDAGRVRESKVFAHNELALIVPLDNPAGIHTFADLPRAERLVIATGNVPVGRYTREALRLASLGSQSDFEKDVLSRVVSEESNVRLARAKVELGEADAALVYVTDALASSRVRLIGLPDDVRVRADYLMGVVERTAVGRTADHGLAEEWIAFVLSPQGRAVLTRHGFTVE